MAVGRGAAALGEPAPGAVAVEDESRRSPALPVRPLAGPPAADAAAASGPRAPSAPGAAGTRGRGRGGARLMCTCALEVRPLLE